MKRLSHPHILTLHEVHETKNSIYLVLDVVKGGELLRKIREKQLISHKDLANVMRNLLEALAHIHENGIMHRDLKPENILLREENNIADIVIADFGLASLTNLPLNEILFKRCGTPGFVAPEILGYKDGQEEFYDEKCDIFSAGVILHILLTGKKPFAAGDYKEILKLNRNCTVNFASSLYSMVDPKGIFYHVHCFYLSFTIYRINSYFYDFLCYLLMNFNCFFILHFYVFL